MAADGGGRLKKELAELEKDSSSGISVKTIVQYKHLEVPHNNEHHPLKNNKIIISLWRFYDSGNNQGP